MRPRYSSLPLQVVIYFNGWYLALLYLAELALVVYKGERENVGDVWVGMKWNGIVTMATLTLVI